jgi:hypothetical protein
LPSFSGIKDSYFISNLFLKLKFCVSKSATNANRQPLSLVPVPLFEQTEQPNHGWDEAKNVAK